MQNIIPFIARCFLSGIFLMAGYNHAVNFGDTVSSLQDKGVGIPQFFAGAAVAFLLLGALSLILGYKTKLGALLLLIFIVIVTILFHWDFAVKMQTLQLLKNVSIAGGLLMVIAYGPGGISLDGKTKLS